MRKFLPDYATVWRWHYYAGLFCLPFIVWLSVTGMVYLFKPQIDSLIDWKYDHIVPSGTLKPADVEICAALSALPGSQFLAYELSPVAGGAARIIVQKNNDSVRIYVNPYSLNIMGMVREESRFERVVFKLHGQLLAGNVGSAIMEMVASWTIVLVVSGFYLWWPRKIPGRSMFRGGVVFIRKSSDRRTMIRDLHAVVGSWVSLIVVLFLVSGLPWSFVWGHALQSVEHTIGRISTIADWEIGAVPAGSIIAGKPNAVATMDMPGMDMPSMQMNSTAEAFGGIANAVVTAAKFNLPAPVILTRSARQEGGWHVRSDTQNRPQRVGFDTDEAGNIVNWQHFSNKPVVDRVVGYGVAAHEGQLFGIANQLLNLFVACGLVCMSVAAMLLWLRRKPPRLSVPQPARRGSMLGLWLILALLGVVLPELGCSLVILAIVSWWSSRRVRAAAVH